MKICVLFKDLMMASGPKRNAWVWQDSSKHFSWVGDELMKLGVLPENLMTASGQQEMLVL